MMKQCILCSNIYIVCFHCVEIGSKFIIPLFVNFDTLIKGSVIGRCRTGKESRKQRHEKMILYVTCVHKAIYA